MSDSNRVWRLTIEKSNGNCLSICGSEEVLRAELDDWVGFETLHSDKAGEASSRGDEYVEWESTKPRVVNGFASDASRTQVVTAYRFCDIIGMTLAEI